MTPACIPARTHGDFMLLDPIRFQLIYTVGGTQGTHSTEHLPLSLLPLRLAFRGLDSALNLSGLECVYLVKSRSLLGRRWSHVCMVFCTFPITLGFMRSQISSLPNEGAESWVSSRAGKRLHTAWPSERCRH